MLESEHTRALLYSHFLLQSKWIQSLISHQILFLGMWADVSVYWVTAWLKEILIHCKYCHRLALYSNSRSDAKLGSFLQGRFDNVSDVWQYSWGLTDGICRDAMRANYEPITLINFIITSTTPDRSSQMQIRSLASQTWADKSNFPSRSAAARLS